MNPDGSFRESRYEMLEILTETYMPGCKDEANEEPEPENFSVPSIN